MEKENEKKIVNNDQYKERFQFLLWINNDIICQRYFRVNGYNSDSLVSEELYYTLDECVNMIKQDIKYKSFLYQSIVGNRPLKISGFVNDPKTATDLGLILDKNIEGEVQLSDGSIIEKEYFTYPEGVEDPYNDDEVLEPYEVTFKFEFIVDDKKVYERIWDGTEYPKQIRNSVDLTNSNAYYNLDNVTLSSMENISRYLKYGRKDLLYYMIKKICDVMSGGFDDPDAYTKSMIYPNGEDGEAKKYSYSTYDREFVNGYGRWMSGKTKKYLAEINRYEKYKEYGGLTPGEWSYIEKYL